VDELELLLRAVLGFSREGASPLLRDDAGVVELLDVLDHRQRAHHGLLAELVQRVEVEMPKPLVPAPSFVILACGEAERLGRLEMEDIEAVCASSDLD
jgi:hypothetical protein